MNHRVVFSRPGMFFPRKKRLRRPGTLLLLVLCALVVIVMFLGDMTRSMVKVQHSGDRHERDLQSMLVAEAGLDRAVARITADTRYRGERWTIPAAQLGQPWAAEVLIRVEPRREEGLLEVHVESHYPLDMPARHTHIRTAVISDTALGDLP